MTTMATKETLITTAVLGGCVAAAFLAGSIYGNKRNNSDNNSDKNEDTQQTHEVSDELPAATRPVASQDLHGAPLLRERVVIVTGASSGIGREVALSCATHGARVIVMDVREDPLEGGATTLKAWSSKSKTESNNNGGDIVFFKGDTTSTGEDDSCEAVVDYAVSKWGRVDVWVNNAAIGVGGNLLETRERDWDRVLAVNAKGYWLGAKAAVKQMLKQPIASASGLRGRVINISSQHGMVACPGDIAYGVGKAAAVYMTRQIAVDYAASHIACNAVAPGKIVTGLDSDVREYSIQRTPCPRLGTPADVASAVLFLASDMCSNFITGNNLMVDGGWMCK